MRKLILNVAVTVDGFIEGPNGEYDWCYADQDYGMTEFLNKTDSIFFGRKSYEVFIKEGAAMWPDKKRFVFSNTLTSLEGNVVLINGDIIDKVRMLENEPGKDIWLFGGASLTDTFIKEKLVDEVMLSVHPILLGKGKPLFDLNRRIGLKLIESKSYSTGLVQNTYGFLY
jgi:dihydrofolate reductase